MKKFFSIFSLIFPWIVVVILFLSLKFHWFPSYFSHLFSGILLLWVFLEDCWELHKNPGKKLRWFEYFELIFFPVGSLFSFYVFWLQIPH